MVVPDDWDRALNYQIGDPPSLALVIRDDNAAALGFDLDAFENGLENSHSLDLRFRGTSGNMSAPDNISSAIFRSGQVIDVPGWRLVDIEVEEMRVNVDYYFWHSILTGLRTAKISFEIDASGRIVPEPAAFVLGLLAVAGMAAVIGRRAR
jgi:hypothetical protein